MNQLLLSKPTVRTCVIVHTSYGPATFISFNHLSDQKEHIAVIYGHVTEVPLVRIHSECLTGDVFSSAHCDCGNQLHETLRAFSEKGGVLLYLRQEGRGIGLYNKLEAYALQRQGYDTFEANHLLQFPNDLRDYTVAAQMLQALDLQKIRLVSNNPDKVVQLEKNGITIVETISTGMYENPHNEGYLASKRSKQGHVFTDNNLAQQLHPITD